MIGWRSFIINIINYLCWCRLFISQPWSLNSNNSNRNSNNNLLRKKKKKKAKLLFCIAKHLKISKVTVRIRPRTLYQSPDLHSGLLLPLKEMREVLPAAVTVLCLAECKEQAENYRQGEVPGCYNANPCWDNNLRWRLAESPKFNFGKEGSVNNIVELIETRLTTVCQKVNVRSKEKLKRCPFIIFSPFISHGNFMTP